MINTNLSDEFLQDKCSQLFPVIQGHQSINPVGSIVFCAHNEEKYLIPTIEALSKLKTNLPIEILAVNNASTDRTREILCQSGIKVIDEKIKGISYARNAGLEAAKGEIIFQTDADTKVPSTWIDEHNANYNDTTIGGVVGGIKYEDIHLIFSLYRCGVLGFHFMLGLLNKRPIGGGGANLSYRVSDARKIGGFHEGTNLGEDTLLIQKIAKIKQIKTIKNSRINTLTNGRRFNNLEKSVNFIKWRASGVIQRVKTDYVMELHGDFEDIR